MSDIKEERMKEIIRQKASEFLERESSGGALLTVTNVKLIERGTKALISFTVFPADKENGALDFAKRKRSDFRDFLKKETKLFRLPFIDFEIDLGEKNRQKIDEISNM
ncbi:MAG: Ribosome-binding factor A [Parcubacteria group bacterium GW2011_GWA2_47_16]|nr:MAG: Ribosome-binding factor A [Parcubacteria group bacterium GW2011_GWA2_47_16]